MAPTTPAQQQALREKLARIKNKTPRDPNAPRMQHPRAASRSTTPYSSRSRSATPAAQASKRTAAESNQCPECRSTNIKKEDGNITCLDCGRVLSESHIAAEVTFQEGANGAAQMLGHHVGADMTAARQEPGVGRTLGAPPSADMTTQQAKYDILQLATRMGIHKDIADQGHRVWIVAFQNNKTKGRERLHSQAVCLYISCKKNSDNKFLLIDFADAINCNVFFLGRIYQDICRTTNATLFKQTGDRFDKVNIENLIHRYAQDLNFGGQTFKIASEAVRIFKRMDRDWIATGRRPSGLCGAAIILAARMNNFRRTVREVVYTVKVCEATVNERLKDFSYTEASKLTVADFRAHVEHELQPHDYYKQAEDDGDGVTPCNPPAFYRQHLPKKTRKRKRTANEEDEEDEESVVPDDDSVMSGLGSVSPEPESEQAESSTSRPRKRTRNGRSATPSSKQSASARRKAQADREAMPPPALPSEASQIDPQLLQASNEAYTSFNDSETPSSAPEAGDHTPEPGASAATATAAARPKRVPKPMLELNQAGEEALKELEEDMQAATTNPDHVKLAETAHNEEDPAPEDADLVIGEDDAEVEDDEPEVEEEDPESPNHEDLKLPMQQDHNGNWIPKVYFPATADLLKKHTYSETISEEEFADDPEVNDIILTEEEINIKENIWITKYGEYVRAQAMKKLNREIDEKNGVIKTRAKRKKPMLGDVSGYEKYPDGTVAHGMAEVYKKLWQHRGEKGMSDKIDWNRVQEIYDEKGSDDGRSGTPDSDGRLRTPQSIFENILIKKPKRKQPTTRQGREELKKANAEKRAARKAERQRNQRENGGATPRSSAETETETQSDRGRTASASVEPDEEDEEVAEVLGSGQTGEDQEKADEQRAANAFMQSQIEHDLGEEVEEDENMYDDDDADSVGRPESEWGGEEV